MEKEKAIDFVEPQASEHLEGIFWQWQSGLDSDLWAEDDPAKWTWQYYSKDDGLILEEAFLLKKGVADLKEYEVDLKRMLQVNKNFRNRIRRVRRQVKSRFSLEISKPVAVVRDDKTMNEAFGTIQHFLNYIMKRTPEAYGLYQRLKTLALDSKYHEFEDIIKKVVMCLEKGAETREKIWKTRSGAQTKTYLAEAKEVVHLIENNSAILGDFLKAILKVSTMEIFICYWLNELLRSEDWEEINVLTPFLVCLVYTFKRSEYVVNYKKPQGFMKNLLGFVMKPKLWLFRGAALTKEHLGLYDLKKIKYFSWNGITSTSRDKNIALNFLLLSMENSKKLNEAKVGILFQIEADFTSSEDCEGMIDISPNSRYPEEKEIILAPGTVFELLKSRLVEGDIREINLKITKEFEETKEEIVLLGTLQAQAIFKDKAIIDGLPSEQSFRMLELLKGNKLIRKLEIRNSDIEEHLMEEIENLRVKTNIERQDIKLKDNTVVASSLGLLAHYFSAENLNEIFMRNKIQFKKRGVLKSKDSEIKTLVLNEEVCDKFRKSNQLKELYAKIKDESKIEHLDFSIEKMEITDDDFRDFLQYVKKSKYLLNLRIKVNQAISRDGLEIICKTIGCSRTLNQLSLGVTLSNESLIGLEKAVGFLACLQNLDLKFMSTISNEEVNHLKSTLISLTYLQHLSLNFEKCNKVSDEDLNLIGSGLISLNSLKYLSLCFSECNKVSDKGLNYLKNALVSLRSLQQLSIDFGKCFKISDEGLNHLKDAFILVISLQNLSLNFSYCQNVSDKGFYYLKDALILLISLQHLSLNFSYCQSISDEGLNHIKKTLKSLAALEHLSLKFNSCNKISDEGLNQIKSALISLTFLQHLSLNFSYCQNISDEGLSHLKCALIAFPSLQYLFLCFSECKKISDEGLNYLKSALILLISLQHLSLDFWGCYNISDKGLNYLHNGLMSLTSLEYLSLRFNSCNKISDRGLKHLKSALVSLTSLQHLSLYLWNCDKISSEEVYHFCDQLKFIPDLSCIN